MVFIATFLYLKFNTYVEGEKTMKKKSIFAVAIIFVVVIGLVGAFFCLEKTVISRLFCQKVWRGKKIIPVQKL